MNEPAQEPKPKQSDLIRQHVIDEYVEPARKSGARGFTVRAGNVHKELGLSNAMPAVCSALGATAFTNLAGARLTKREGPNNSSTFELTFEFLGAAPSAADSAEAELRRRYGEPIKDTDKIIGFELPDGRQIALDRNSSIDQIWVEDNSVQAPPAGELRHYLPAEGRHSNLPQRLSASPPKGIAPRRVMCIKAHDLNSLRAILDWYESGSVLNRQALDRMKRVFLARFPDFEPGGFKTQSGGYYDEERAYKDKLIAAVAHAMEYSGSVSSEALGAQLLDILVGLGGTLSGLLGWRTDAHIKQIRDAQPGILEQAVGVLATAREIDEAIGTFVENVWPLLSEGQTSKPFSESRNIPTMLAALVHPDQAFGINSDPLSRTAKALMGRPILGSNPLTPHEYNDILSLAHAMRDIMDQDWGWHPQDLWDVQGFIWVVSQADPNMLTNEDDMTLTREAVLKTLDECDQLSVQGFLDRYEFSWPTQYWLEERGKRYPSKAVACVAYKYLPGGSVENFSATTARQRLERLGFTIVNDRTASAAAAPTNLILYGPPGTGKTFQTAARAVELCDGEAPDDRETIKARYDALVESGQIKFVTFHQSYSYEDFVEGLRPVTGGDGDGVEDTGVGFRLEPRPGAFRQIAALAEQAKQNSGRRGGYDLSGRQFFKMSLGRAGSEDHIYEAALEGGYIVLGWGGDVDWSDPRYDNYDAIHVKWNEIQPGTHGSDGNISQLWRFRSSMREGDIVIVSDGNSHFRAIGVIKGPYEYAPTGERNYSHLRKVDWLLKLDDSLPVDTIFDGKFTMRSCYLLNGSRIKREAIARLLPGDSAQQGGSPDQFVLIIDEINRANISKVFGELITLIETDKRLGQPNALTVKLPYSGDSFGVPDNLHIIGTMNTADRSIALLDTALRRRFAFEELMPDYDLEALRDASDRTGIDLSKLLRTLNERIEYLFDREHQIGHAYFVNCRSEVDVHLTMRHKIIPLLAEYFYEDWSKVAVVLGDANGANKFLTQTKLTVPDGLISDGYAEERYRWDVRDEFDPSAFDSLT